MNPTAAQIKRMMGPGPQAIVVVHPPGEDATHVIVGQDMLEFSRNEWQPLPYVSKLGFDILYAAPTTSKFPTFTITAEANATLESLTRNCDPASPLFGHAEHTSSTGVAFKFADGSKAMTKAVLQTLVMFINERFAAIKAALANPEGMVQAIDEYEKLTPYAFRVLFKKYRADQASAYPGKGWKSIECPVAPSMTNCETCGKKAEDAVTGENALQQCGRCKKVRYCGRDCQAEDWKAHKPFCRE